MKTDHNWHTTNFINLPIWSKHGIFFQRGEPSASDRCTIWSNAFTFGAILLFFPARKSSVIRSINTLPVIPNIGGKGRTSRWFRTHAWRASKIMAVLSSSVSCPKRESEFHHNHEQVHDWISVVKFSSVRARSYVVKTWALIHAVSLKDKIWRRGNQQKEANRLWNWSLAKKRNFYYGDRNANVCSSSTKKVGSVSTNH